MQSERDIKASINRMKNDLDALFRGYATDNEGGCCFRFFGIGAPPEDDLLTQQRKKFAKIAMRVGAKLATGKDVAITDYTQFHTPTEKTRLVGSEVPHVSSFNCHGESIAGIDAANDLAIQEVNLQLFIIALSNFASAHVENSNDYNEIFAEITKKFSFVLNPQLVNDTDYKPHISFHDQALELGVFSILKGPLSAAVSEGLSAANVSGTPGKASVTPPALSPSLQIPAPQPSSAFSEGTSVHAAPVVKQPARPGVKK